MSNGVRLSCGATRYGSQMQFYHRRRAPPAFQAHVRRQSVGHGPMRVEELPFRAVSQDDSSEETVFVRMMPLSVDLALVIRGCEQRQARSEWADAEVGAPLQLNVRKSPREVLNGAGRRVTG